MGSRLVAHKTRGDELGRRVFRSVGARFKPIVVALFEQRYRALSPFRTSAVGLAPKRWSGSSPGTLAVVDCKSKIREDDPAIVLTACYLTSTSTYGGRPPLDVVGRPEP